MCFEWRVKVSNLNNYIVGDGDGVKLVVPETIWRNLTNAVDEIRSEDLVGVTPSDIEGKYDRYVHVVETIVAKHYYKIDCDREVLNFFCNMNFNRPGFTQMSYIQNFANDIINHYYPDEDEDSSLFVKIGFCLSTYGNYSWENTLIKFENDDTNDMDGYI